MLPTRPATPPPPQPHPSSGSAPSIDQTPTQSTYSPVLPKSKSRQIAGGLPQGPSRPSPPGGSASPQQLQSLSPPPPYQPSHVATNHPVSPQGGGAPPSQRVDPTAHVPSFAGSLRSSVCHALGSKHLGRLSAVGLEVTQHHHHQQQATTTTASPCVTPVLATVMPVGTWSQNPSLLETSLSPERQANQSVNPDDSVSQRGGATSFGGGIDPISAGTPGGGGEYSGSRSGRSPVAVEPFLATAIPSGRFLVFNMLSTWGDQYEVGLRGVQLFDADGNDIIAGITNGSIANQFVVLQDAVDASALPSRETSPRHVDVFEGTEEVTAMMTTTTMQQQQRPERATARPVPTFADRSKEGEAHSEDAGANVDRLTQQRHNVYNLLRRPYEPTSDEAKMYVTPFVDGRHHLICIAFQYPVKLSCIRVFNYSGGGRTKTSKGVRLLEALLDDAVIFRGEIEQAAVGTSGGEGLGSSGCETILFTEDRAVLENVVVAAAAQRPDDQPYGTDSTARALLSSFLPSPQPTTTRGPDFSAPLAARQARRGIMEQVTTSICFAPSTEGAGGGLSESLVSPPYCRSSSKADTTTTRRKADAVDEGAVLQPSISTSLGTRAGVIGPCVFPNECPRGVTSVCLQILSTWGDPAYFGLSGLRFRDPQGRPIFNISFCAVNRPTGKTLTDDDDFDLSSLVDGDPNTACAWAFEPSVQLIVAFQHAVDLGFVELANYSFEKRTHCGIKHARLFACQLPVVSISPGIPISASGTAASTSSASSSQDPNSSARRTLSLLYARLWDLEADVSPRALPGVLELTPSEGIVLRKAPAMMTTLRFQRFDISLSAYDSGPSSSSGNRMSSSLRLSMQTRATVAIRRARQSLLEPPEWLLNAQVAVPSILPVGYVFKLSFAFVGNATAPLKSIMTSAAAHPHETAEFISDEGTVVDAKELWCEGLVSYTKSVSFPKSAGDENEDTEELPRVWVTLVFVADAPFAISAVVLRCPRVVEMAASTNGSGTGERDGNTVAPVAWLEQLLVSADDTPVFESVHVSTPDAYRRAAPDLGPGSPDPCVPSVVFLTLDSRILSVYRHLLGE